VARSSAGDTVDRVSSDDDDPGRRILDAHAALVAAGVIERLSPDPEETRLWLDCELASLVENRFFEAIDPCAITPEIRAAWEPRATSEEPLSSPHGQAWYRLPYWIKEGGERAGTIALATMFMGPSLVTVSSLYTLPSHRRRGIAGRALRRAHDAVVAHGGRGLRVPTHWTWQPAVRFYLGLGMWISSWKHSLVFGWRDDLPRFRAEVGEREARFYLGEEPVIEASREGDRLGWNELPRLAEILGDYHHAAGTFAIALATHGFPLIRSEATWARRHRWADMGAPEGLAYKIELWEAWEREHGHLVRTPRIPGIAYRAHDAID
jgi:GNAT superfamily N-acetyltransferase